MGSIKRKGKRKRMSTINKILLFSFISYMVVIGYLDDIQQKRLYTVRCAYEAMHAGDYSTALSNFQTYADGRSELYWTLMEKYGDELNKRPRVEQAMAMCEKMIKRGK